MRNTSVLDELAEEIDKLRTKFADGKEDGAAMPPRAELHFMLAIDALSSAERFMTLAHYDLMRGE